MGKRVRGTVKTLHMGRWIQSYWREISINLGDKNEIRSSSIGVSKRMKKTFTNPTKRLWIISFVFAIISLIAFLATFLKKLPDPHWIGDVYAYNFGFWFPLMGISILFLFLAVIFLVRFRRSNVRMRVCRFQLKVTIILILLAPVVVQLLYTIWRIGNVFWVYNQSVWNPPNKLLRADSHEEKWMRKMTRMDTIIEQIESVSGSSSSAKR